ncbi:MAG: hypothetical protein V7L31_29550 [Nostoc sp.]
MFSYLDAELSRSIVLHVFVTAIATTRSNCRYKALAIHLPLGDAC